MLDTYNLFISHSWTYENHYDLLVERLNSQSNIFRYRNYSVPKDDPIHNANNDVELAEAIARQIAPASCVIVLGGVYATYSKWISIELMLALLMGKKIIVIEPLGSKRTSEIVEDVADRSCCLDALSIVHAIKETVNSDSNNRNARIYRNVKLLRIINHVNDFYRKNIPRDLFNVFYSNADKIGQFSLDSRYDNIKDISILFSKLGYK